MDGGKTALLIGSYLVVWTLFGILGFFTADTAAFQCHHGERFVVRAWNGYVGDKEKPVYPILRDQTRDLLITVTDPIRSAVDLGKLKEMESMERKGALIGGTLLGYSIGESVRYAASAHPCP